MMMNFETVLDFWFGDISEGHVEDQYQAMWYRGDKEDDAIIKGRFTSFLLAASKGELDDWLVSARGRLALIIVLDQFSRHIFRGTANAFLYDDQALRIAREGIDMKLDEYLSVVERLFFYMPYQHAENPGLQEEGIVLFQKLVDDADTEQEQTLSRQGLEFAKKHRDIITRFGRFPHRNKALLRESTMAELGYLGSGAPSFGQ